MIELNAIIGDSLNEPKKGFDYNSINVIAPIYNLNTPTGGMGLAPAINYNGAYYSTDPIYFTTLGIPSLEALKIINLSELQFIFSTSWIQREGFFTDPTTQSRSWDIYFTVGIFNSNLFNNISKGLSAYTEPYFKPMLCFKVGKLLFDQPSQTFFLENQDLVLDALKTQNRARNSSGEIFDLNNLFFTDEDVKNLQNGCVLACTAGYDLTQAPMLENEVIANAGIRLTPTFGFAYKGALSTF